MTTENLRTKDMYGHPIYPLGDTGYGVSISFYTQGDSPPAPDFTFFHNSDGFRQALFSLQIDPGETPQVSNIFRDRMDAVEALVERDYLRKVLADWKLEIANCTNCHYHRHVARSTVPDYGPNGKSLCDECREDVEEL